MKYENLSREELESLLDEKNACIQKLMMKNSKLEKLANKDPLTGALNKFKGLSLLRKSMAIADKANKSFALCFIDINNFKNINDELGHIEGDNYLTKASDIFKRHLRKTDFVVRFGGDEFLIILKNCNYEGALSVMHRIENTIKKFNIARQSKLPLEISYGISIYKPNFDITAKGLVESADKFMYLNKKMKKTI